MVNFEELYKGSAYTITGAGGNLKEWKEGYQDLLQRANIGKIKKWYDFTGKEMNDYYKLTGKNAYPSDIHFLAFPLDGLDVGKLAVFKIEMNDRWFDDIVDNNKAREEPETYEGHKTIAKQKKSTCNIKKLENSVRRMF